MHKACKETLDRLENEGVRVNHGFNFPARRPLTKRLKGVLETEVDEKYYLTDGKARTLKFSDVSKTIRSSGRGSLDKHTWDIVKVPIKTANKTGYDLATDGDGIDLAYPDSKTRRGRVGHGVSKTLPTSDSQGVMDGFRIRKLTPKECWRLMGFDDADFEKAEKVNSNTQLYKQAGNSIVVNVLEAILGELL